MIKFTLPYPPTSKQKAAFCKRYGLNAIYSGKHWAERKEDKDFWKWFVLSELRKQGISATYINKPVEITFSWDDGLDCSNHAYMAKMIEDALVGYVLKNDNRKHVNRIVHEFNNVGHIEIEIVEV